VHVFALLDGTTAVLGGVENLVCETINHGLLAALASEADQPSHSQGL
jgi:hypothetical protein